MKLKKYLPTVVCIFLALIITCGVVFLPQFYYKFVDSQDNWGGLFETFTFGTVNRHATNDEYIQLIGSGETMWIFKQPEISNDELSQTVQTSLEGVLNCVDSNEYITSNLKKVIELTSTTEPIDRDFYYVRGAIGDTIVDVNLMYVQYAHAVSEDVPDTEYVTLLINTDSNTVYEMSYDFYSSEDVGSLEDNSSYETEQALMQSALKSYWQVDTAPENITVVTDKYMFYFNIYTEYFVFYCDNPIKST